MGPEFLRGFALILGYLGISAALTLTMRKLFTIPNEVFRKILHLIVLGAIALWTYAFDSWWIAVSSVLVFVIIVYPVLALGERILDYSTLLVERKKGELKRSLVTVCAMLVVLLILCWGLLGERYLVIASVAAWGLGDAAAAIVGKRFGKHHIEGEYIEGRKSVEGTVAMFVVSFFSVLLILLLRGSLPWHGYVPISLATAAVSAVVELYTKDGMDTITCPLAAAATLIPLLFLWGGLS